MSRYFKALIVAAWLGFAAWFVRHEAFPEWFTSAAGGYDRLVPSDVMVDETWMRVLVNGQPVGYAHSGVERDSENPVHNTILKSDMHLLVSMMGERQNLRVNMTANLDVLMRLQDFSFDFSSAGYAMKIRGVRRDGNSYRVSMRTGGVSNSLDIEIPDDVVLYSPMIQLRLKQLKPGRSLTLKTMDPMTMQPTVIHFEALRHEPVTVGGVTYPEATLIEAKHRDMAVKTWLDGEGMPLKQETPFGWTLEKCSFDEAMKALRAAGNVDIAAGLAVQCSGRLRDPQGAKHVRLAIQGPGCEGISFPSGRVAVESLTATSAVISVSAQAPAPRGGALSGVERAAALATSPFVQADAPAIRKVALEIVGAETNDTEKARLIHEWVHARLEKTPTVSIPSALEVLASRRGDCNEHAILHVALARAAGLPARQLSGLVYHEGRFMYHAWPAVWEGGGWVEADPTWGQRYVDATHIPLVEGDLGDQAGLIRVMGRIRVVILGEGDGADDQR
ncbi:MAG: transglutaminase domain-containing protein [Lentisphaerae bacterium]|nr:transglutaminase domain-containing protein [Lentisphaerota bacterium]